MLRGDYNIHPRLSIRLNQKREQLSSRLNTKNHPWLINFRRSGFPKLLAASSGVPYAGKRCFRGQARTSVRDARASFLEEDLEAARAATLKAVSALDKAAEKGVLHKNNASRRKGCLMKQLAALEKQNA